MKQPQKQPNSERETTLQQDISRFASDLSRHTYKGLRSLERFVQSAISKHPYHSKKR